MSINNEKSIEPVLELGLALGYCSNQSMQRRRFMSNDSGAGANAGSGLDMTFVTNPLSELVWSPHKGPSNVALLPAHRITSTRNVAVHHRRLCDEEDFLTLSTPSPMKSGAGGQADGKEEVMSVPVPDREDEKGTCDDVHVSPVNLNEEIRDVDRDSVLARVESQIDDKLADTRENYFSGPREPRAEDISESPIDEERNVGVAREKIASSSAIATRVFHVLEKMESTSENDLNNLGAPNKAAALELSRQVKVGSRLARETYQTDETLSDRAFHVNRRKGKERALSEGDLNAMMLKNGDDDDDESHKSAESCNSARPLTMTSKRKRSSEEGLVSDSKGISSKQIVQCALRSTPVAKKDSSFVNWISNVMKGLSQSVQEEPAAPIHLSVAGPSYMPENSDRRLVPFDGDRDLPPATHKIIGFQSMFQSLYSSRLNVECPIEEGSKEVDMSNNNTDPEGNSGQQVLRLTERFVDSRNEDNTKEKTNSEDSNGGDNNLKSALELMNKGKERMSSDFSLGKRMRNSTERGDSEPQSPRNTASKFSRRNDVLGSSWITRFSPKILNQCAVAEDQPPASGNEIEKTAIAIKGLEDPTTLNPKHVISSRVSSNATCFFCGVKGHNLRDCSEVTGSELNELLRNFESRCGAEEPSRFCVRCFQHDHWAVSCSKAPLKKPIEGESSKLKTRKLSEGDGDLRMRTAFDWKVDEVVSLKERKSRASLVHRHVTSNLVENLPRVNPIASLPFFVAKGKNPSVPRGLFDDINRLRLSRGDVMKWMNSQMSVLHIEGFYLRLRLGKWEEGLGGTGYHVACIIGAQRDNKQKDRKSSLLVQVGGIKCWVESRYVSNNDFLEDELMAWWCNSIRNGDKIPSEEDLRMKIKTKEP